MNIKNVKNKFPLVILSLCLLHSCANDNGGLIIDDSKEPTNTNGGPAQNIGSEYDLRTEFGTVEELSVKTDGIFAIWWDPKFDHEDDLPMMFSWLNQVRTDCLNNLGMSDPPNPIAGYYFNVYIHHGSNDGFPEGWANGVGTDRFDMPYMALPDGAHLDKLNVFHEAFHIFQFNSNSDGFDYVGDAAWYIEASAQWFMASRNPDDESSFLEALTISSNPQLALWHGFGNGASGDPEGDWLYEVRQYGLHTYLYYLTEVVKISPSVITDGFYGGVDISPQQYLFEKIGANWARSHFADWAAHNTNTDGFDYITSAQWQRAVVEFERNQNPAHFNPYALSIEGSNISGTHRPNQGLLPRGWAYNVIKITNVPTGSINFTLNGEASGSEGGAAHFEGRIVLKGNSGIRYLTVEMDNDFTGSMTFDAAVDEDECYIVVASVPGHFDGNQTYGYSVEISTSD